MGYSAPLDSRPTSKWPFKRPTPMSESSPTRAMRDPLFVTHVMQYFISSALLLLCLLQCVKGNNYLNVGLVNTFFSQKKRAIITPF